MTYNLTPKQKRVLKWLIEEEKAAHIEQGFHIVESRQRSYIVDYSGETIPEFSVHLLDSLVSENMLLRDLIMKSDLP